MISNPAAASCAAKELPCLYNVTVVEGGYKMKQVFKLDEIGLLWKDVEIFSFICHTEDSRKWLWELQIEPLMVFLSQNPWALN
jgi:hypothetical protein